jgi:hypothetical protein
VETDHYTHKDKTVSLSEILASTNKPTWCYNPQAQQQQVIYKINTIPLNRLHGNEQYDE